MDLTGKVMLSFVSPFSAVRHMGDLCSLALPTLVGRKGTHVQARIVYFCCRLPHASPVPVRFISETRQLYLSEDKSYDHIHPSRLFVFYLFCYGERRRLLGVTMQRSRVSGECSVSKKLLKINPSSVML